MSDKQNVQVNVQAAPDRPEDEAYTPLCDIWEDGNGTVYIAAELPGARQDSVDIRVDKGVLTIEADGRRETPGEGYASTYRGFATGPYFRAFALSDEVDRDQIGASLVDGVLTVALPRGQQAQTRKIPIG